MNRAKWKECSDGRRLLIKLSEEVGEVSQRVGQMLDDIPQLKSTRRAQAIEELGHVIFIAGRLRDVLTSIHEMEARLGT